MDTHIPVLSRSLYSYPCHALLFPPPHSLSRLLLSDTHFSLHGGEAPEGDEMGTESSVV